MDGLLSVALSLTFILYGRRWVRTDSIEFHILGGVFMGLGVILLISAGLTMLERN